ncbi:MAG: hypothetical protein WCN98_12320, partial [Verrucomicrobiaceae bacterium]
MEAVAALYSDGHGELSEAIIASLSRAVFKEGPGAAAGWARRFMARVSYQILKCTTTRRSSVDGDKQSDTYHNPILHRSGHPYANSLLASSSAETAELVEGGDPMNGPYMMIVPEIRKAGNVWDRIFFDSVQASDVQLRFIWETQATYESALFHLEKSGVVRMKSLAAGTGLSMILVYDRLVREGHVPDKITAVITDRDSSNTQKTIRLLAKLTTTRGRIPDAENGAGISARTEDVFDNEATTGQTGARKFDVVTAVGIFEYLQGCTCETTEQRHKLEELAEDATAHHLVERLDAITTDDATVIINTYRPHSSTRILELFGKKFDYREREDLATLLATANFRTARLVGTGHIYDVKVYEKNLLGRTVPS